MASSSSSYPHPSICHLSAAVSFCCLLLFADFANSQSSQPQQKKIIVHYGNRTFDVTSFVPFHPGGPLVLQHVNGKDVAEYLAGHKSVKLPEMGGISVQHHHGPGAFHVLNSLEIKQGESSSSSNSKGKAKE